MKRFLRLAPAIFLAVSASAAVEEVRPLEVSPVAAAGLPTAVSLEGPLAALPAPASVVPLSPAALETAAAVRAAQPASVQAAARPAEVQAFLAVARTGAQSEESAEFLAQAPRLFDGLSPEHQEHALEGLLDLAKAEPKRTVYREALQRLLIRDELRRIEPRLREKELTEARQEDVLAKTRFKDIKWYHHLWDEVTPIPEGIARRETLTIGLNVKSGWRKLPSFIGHFRTIFSHEYTHRLQFEGEVTEKLGMEIPPVAAEILRGIELFGLKGLKEGKLTAVGEGINSAFDDGRAWARAPTAELWGFYWKGFLAGAAYELAVQTGRWSDAWAFHRLVSNNVAPVQALERVRAAKP